MKQLLILSLFIFSIQASFSQRIHAADEKFLHKKEDSLKRFAEKIVQGKTPNDRFQADSLFTKMFVRALKTSNSFFYPFDSLATISKLCPPDSSFRIYTWQLVVNDFVVRQHGAIQMRTFDGSLKLFPLIDKSDVTTKLQDTIGNNKGWIGAVYYRILQTKSGNEKFYTLLGFDEHNINSDRKIIEVLTFTGEEPIFGSRNFSFENDAVFKSSISRYVMEYKDGAGARLNYDPELNVILVGHLNSETNEPAKKFTYIPDGDYEGFRWQSGKWIHIENVRNYTKRDNSEILANTIYDADGNVDPTKLKGHEDDDDKQPPEKNQR